MNKTTTLFLAALLLLSGSIEALAQSADKGPKLDDSALQNPPKPDEKPAARKPGVRGSDVYRQGTTRTDVELEDLIKQLSAIIQYSEDDDEEKPKAYGNLGLLYWEKSESYYNQANSDEMRKAMLVAVDSDNMAELERLKGEQQKLMDLQVEWRRKAIKVYKAIEEKYSTYPKIDMVLFYLGVSLNQVEEYEEAFQYFKKLVTQFPGSTYIPDGLVNLGDYYFDQAQFPTAIEFYKRVEKFEDHKIFSYALYRQAWAYYNMQDYQESFKKFIGVINYQDEIEAKGGVPKLSLKEQALEDIVLAYTHIGSEKEAMEFFKKISPNNYMALSANLAANYLENGRAEQSIFLFKQVISKEPASPKVLEYQFLIATAAEILSKNDKKLLERELDTLAATYSSFVTAHPEVAAKMGEKVQFLFLQISIAYHKEFETTKKTDALELTQKAYEYLIKFFPEGRGNYETQYNHATLLYQLGKFEKAAAAFDALYLADPKGKYAGDAISFSVRSYFKQFGATLAAKAVADSDDLPRSELTEAEAGFIVACDRLLEHGGGDPEDMVQAMLTPVYVYYNKNQFPEAGQRSARFIEAYPKSPEATDAAMVLLSSYALAKDIPSLNTWADKIFAMPDLAQGKVLIVIQKIRNEAKFNRCFEYEFRKEFESAAECFLEYSRLFPKSDLIDKAYLNAGINFGKARKYEQALKVNEYLYNCCAKSSKFGPRALYNIAQTYQAAGVYDTAAQYFEEFFKRHPKEPVAEQAIFRAASLRRALGQYDQAIKNYEIIFKSFKKDSRIPAMVLDIGSMYSLKQEYKKADTQFRKYIKSFGKTGGYSLLLEAHRNLGEVLLAQRKYDDARKSFVEVIKAFGTIPKEERGKLSGRAVFALAWAYFNLGDDLYDQAAKIKYTRANLQAATTQKLTLVDQGDQYFKVVRDLGSPYWTVLSYYRQGQANEKFAYDLEKSPLPGGMSDDERADYLQKLADFTNQYRQAAAAFYSKCLDEATSAKIFNEFTEKAEARLAETGGGVAGMSEYRIRPDHLDLNAVMPLFKGREVKVFVPQDESQAPSTSPSTTWLTAIKIPLWEVAASEGGDLR